MSRGGKRKSVPARIVQTLRGPASYIISGQTPEQWRVIETALACCDSPDLRIVLHQPEPKHVSARERTAAHLTRKLAGQTAPQLAHAFQRDISELSGLLAPWITSVDHRRVHQLETRLDHIVDAWEAALGKGPARERQPLT